MSSQNNEGETQRKEQSRTGQTATSSEKKSSREPWEFGRALKTILYFNPPPSPSQVAKSALLAPWKVAKAVTRPIMPKSMQGEEEKKVTRRLPVSDDHGGVAIFDPRVTQDKAPARDFGPIDDVVMGGVSRSGFTIVNGAGEEGAPAGVFSGDVTTANSGGFASVRTRNMDPALDLSEFDGLEIRIFGK